MKIDLEKERAELAEFLGDAEKAKLMEASVYQVLADVQNLMKDVGRFWDNKRAELQTTGLSNAEASSVCLTAMEETLVGMFHANLHWAGVEKSDRIMLAMEFGKRLLLESMQVPESDMLKALEELAARKKRT